jgi:CheY-like chemotaxis protein
MQHSQQTNDVRVETKLLLTEDQKINQEIFIGLLEGSGINIDIASNGKEAVEKSSAVHYSLIVMDIDMPIMNGYEATRSIRKFNKKTPIIALTSNSTTQDIMQTKDAGMNEHLTKPVLPPVLFQTLSKYIHLKEM